MLQSSLEEWIGADEARAPKELVARPPKPPLKLQKRGSSRPESTSSPAQRRSERTRSRHRKPNMLITIQKCLGSSLIMSGRWNVPPAPAGHFSQASSMPRQSSTHRQATRASRKRSRSSMAPRNSNVQRAIYTSTVGKTSNGRIA